MDTIDRLLPSKTCYSVKELEDHARLCYETRTGVTIMRRRWKKTTNDDDVNRVACADDVNLSGEKIKSVKRNVRRN
jgi:hypothetical protein